MLKIKIAQLLRAKTIRFQVGHFSLEENCLSDVRLSHNGNYQTLVQAASMVGKSGPEGWGLVGNHLEGKGLDSGWG